MNVKDLILVKYPFVGLSSITDDIDKSSVGLPVRFARCTFRNVATGFEDKLKTHGPVAPILFYLKEPERTKKQGGVEFVDCFREDNKDRPFLLATEKKSSFGVYDISGSITVRNPYGARMDLGPNSHNVTLKVNEE